jgi:peptide/nickel transport system substrate-binding protein
MSKHEGDPMDAPVAPSTISRRDLLKLGGAAVAAGTALPLVDREPVAAQTPKRGGVFRIRGEDATTGFDPHLFSNHHRISTNLSFTHSRLVRVKAGPSVVTGTLPVEPDLAESWSQPNDRTYVFKLRKGVRWHNKPPVNGRELTAEDVKYTYERFLSIRKANARCSVPSRRSTRSTSTPCASCSEPFGWFLDYLANTVMWIVPREAVEQYGDLKRSKPSSGPGRGCSSATSRTCASRSSGIRTISCRGFRTRTGSR